MRAAVALTCCCCVACQDFTGFGWFRPSEQYRLGLVRAHYTTSPNSETTCTVRFDREDTWAQAASRDGADDVAPNRNRADQTDATVHAYVSRMAAAHVAACRASGALEAAPLAARREGDEVVLTFASSQADADHDDDGGAASASASALLHEFRFPTQVLAGNTQVLAGDTQVLAGDLTGDGDLLRHTVQSCFRSELKGVLVSAALHPNRSCLVTLVRYDLPDRGGLSLCRLQPLYLTSRSAHCGRRSLHGRDASLSAWALDAPQQRSHAVRECGDWLSLLGPTARSDAPQQHYASEHSWLLPCNAAEFDVRFFCFVRFLFESFLSFLLSVIFKIPLTFNLPDLLLFSTRCYFLSLID